MKFQYVTIAVSDLARSKLFYEDVLRFEPNGTYERWQSYKIEGDGGFGIGEDPNLQRVPCLDIINFSLPDIDALWAQVRDHVRVESPPQVMPWATRKFVIIDPDGMRLAFVEKKELYAEYVRFCQKRGWDTKLDSAFSKELLRAIPGLKDAQKTIRRERKRVWKGIRIRDENTNVNSSNLDDSVNDIPLNTSREVFY